MEETTQTPPVTTPPAIDAGDVITSTGSGQVGDLAEVVAQTGPDPVLLAAVIVFGLMMLAVVIYLIRRFQAQQERIIENQHSCAQADQARFAEQLVKQRDEFRTELNTQRSAHTDELSRNSSMFERSLEKIVVTHREAMDRIGGQLVNLDLRLEDVETAIVAVKPNARKRKSPARTATATTTVSIDEPGEI